MLGWRPPKPNFYKIASAVIPNVIYFCHSGALYYAYLTADDNLPASTAGSTNQLICSVKVDNIRDSELNNVISWTIQASSSGISQFEFLAPVVNPLDNDDDTVAEAKDAIECVEGQACNVVCIFGGRLVVILVLTSTEIILRHLGGLSSSHRWITDIVGTK